jgi:diketogulonate reductase-like aldo/keto reductase
VFITSKIWNTYHSYEKCLEGGDYYYLFIIIYLGVDICLKELQLDYIDLMLIHWPHAFAENMGMFPKVTHTLTHTHTHTHTQTQTNNRKKTEQ